MSQSTDVLDRFFEALVREITAGRPEYLTGPFTVAEIYQDLVPYRSHRDWIGVEMNGDYEDALARMLSGEGDYLLLDSEAARRQLQAELASRNPNTALIRDFAAVDVRLHPGRASKWAGTASQTRVETPEAKAAVGEESGARAEDLFREMETWSWPEQAGEEPNASAAVPQRALDEPSDGPRDEVATPADDGVVGHIETSAVPSLVALPEPVSDEAPSSGTRHGGAPTVCRWCREDLPLRGSIRFCPFCGGDLGPVPCRECGEAIEARWRFCASCGADVRA